MFPEIKPGQVSGTAGWTCAICGGYIGSGETHYCAGAQPVTGKFTIGDDYTEGEPIGTIELRQKLDRIIDLLEEICRRVE